MSTQTPARPAEASGLFRLGGDLPVHRLGLGTMRLTGPGVWGDPADPAEAVRVVRRARELGVDFIDTAAAYGPFVSDEIIRRALHPYPEDLVLASKVGLARPGPDQWQPVGRPEFLREQAESSLRHLGVDSVGLMQLHRVDPAVPLADQIGELVLLQQEGKIRHIGLSEVGVEQIERARQIAPIVSVQNLYNLSDRHYEDVLRYCEREGIAFIPWFPIASGALARPDSPARQVAADADATAAQLSLAWLLRHSPVVLPIPGTSTVAHVEENTRSAELTLTDEQYQALTAVA
ncbi:aldo/keto reductase [Frankia sp. CNm7]|uniref:Aldo/keto reductase n=1 Tax=Frankia nepalensis TaxID=1836974 RepID=A0A937RHS3_9ACTN|nr:aldo/keto reductase [Frankia nepalensis]MBL7500809.1 aldo/keto reductase [Frankia nepalensis]MBL7512616.1 aldo/keto reductase [Frankia nepalensis]MBL7524100.1 aldo/keto reductase [Frankia nepalensis]MBL7629215.1 aldo/keto reductase [Frankia nepalensis]